MKGDPHDSDRLTYNDADVVDVYKVATALQACEAKLFRTYIRPSGRILDLGVGAGRTTKYLAAQATEYIGVDYADNMIEACHSRYPSLDFRVMDARNLSDFADREFDTVVFSFNGLGHLFPDDSRVACIKEIWRVLKPGGHFIFSLHNARSLLLRPRRAGTDLGSTLAALGPSMVANIRRFAGRVVTTTFWKGRGYYRMTVHGGMTVFASEPRAVEMEVGGMGFRLREICHEDYPKSGWRLVTRWYYYAFQKSV